MRPLSLAILVCCIAQLCRAADVHEEQAQAAAARQILRNWQEQETQSEPRVVHLVCWTPSDRDFPANYEARLTRIMRHIQQFYLREMERFGFDDHTFRLHYADQKLVLHTVRGQQPTEHYGNSSGHEIRQECLPTLQQAGIDADRETVLIMCNLATWDPEQLRFTHQSPYYAGGSYRGGTAWQLDSPELDSTSLGLKSPLISDGQYGRISMGKHNSIFIGGIAHELGHALGLPHCQARHDEAVRGTALMGSGNRTYGEELRDEGLGSFLTLAHALRLASHPQFSGSVKGLGQECEASIEQLDLVADGKSINVSGIAQGTPPIYAVVAYFDPEGHGDYDATTATAIPDADGHFALSSHALVPGAEGELRLFPLHVNGSAAGQMSQTRFRFPYAVASDGIPDLTTFRIKRELAPLVAAINSRHQQQAAVLAAEIRNSHAAEIASILLQQAAPSQTPAQYDGAANSVSLSSLLPTAATVGWGRPIYNRLPEDSLLLESGGALFKTGLYAHAPARHTYDLGGTWSTLSGTVGLAAGHSGSVEFEILGDGKSLWKSATIKSQRQAFEVRVDGVQTLELVTETTPDGANSDWGLWLEPTLER